MPEKKETAMGDDAPTSAALTVNDGKLRFSARIGMTLFAACRVNGLYLATGCGARGRCGLCGLRVTRGDAGEITEAERARLSQDDIENGARLACQARVKGDVSFAVPEWSFAARPHEATIEEVEVLTRDIRRLRMRLAKDESMDFVPGQFVAFGVKAAPGRPGATRCYSLAGERERAAEPGGYFDLIVRRVPEGVVSCWVMEASVGTTVTCTGPFGGFGLTDTDRDAVFIAGGSGLSPFFSMLPALRDDARARAAGNPARRPRRAVLFFGAQTAADLYRVEELRAFAREHPWFTFWPVVQDGGGDADSESGLVTEALDRRVEDLSNSDAYICGSPGMIAACEAVLSRHGLPPGRVHFDRF